jgi:hypothetical protein
MKQLLLTAFTLSVLSVYGQNAIDWNGEYQLTLADFQSAATQVGNVSHYSLHSASQIDFSYQMTSGEFMFTKNFNSKVGCSFKRNASALTAPDSAFAQDLVRFAQFEFDLSELYARKFRKRIYEEKGAFSNPNFFKPLYDAILEEFSERNALAGKETEVGQKKERLEELHQQVLTEINELSDFCKMCKPPKK